MSKYAFGKRFVLGYIILMIIMLVNLPVVSNAYRSSRKHVVKKVHASEPAISFESGIVGRKYAFEPTIGKVVMVSGSLPPGLKLNTRINKIEGTPLRKGVWKFRVRVVTGKYKNKIFPCVIGIFHPITVGDDGTFKGADGLQMALNTAQDLDAILIEAETFSVTGLVVAESKAWEQGIMISGGWDKTFLYPVPERDNATVLDGGGYQNNIISFQQSQGMVNVEYILFQNIKGTAVNTRNNLITFNNCTFANNSRAVSYDNTTGIFLNCKFINNSTNGYGGAITYSGKGIFYNCVFDNNSANEYGGAVSYSGDGQFNNCTFTNNSALNGGNDGGGGAVYLYMSSYSNGSHGQFNNCTFTNNSLNNGSSSDGGGAVLLSSSDATFNNCIFKNNTVKYGFGGAVGGGSTFNNCTFTSNTAADGGGAVSGGGLFNNCTFTDNSIHNNIISQGGGGAILGDGTFNNSTFIRNSSASDGGSVLGNGTFNNCLFYNNSAKGNGGALNGTENLINCTLFGNTAGKGGGALFGNGNIINTIFYKNTVTNTDSGTTENNDITPGDNLSVDYSLVNALKGSANLGPHNIMGDPKFVDPAKNNFHLKAGSPCINKGTIPKGFNRKFVDLDGKPRIVRSKIDMGAYEH